MLALFKKTNKETATFLIQKAYDLKMSSVEKLYE
jgi:hypothetical protein